MTDFANIFLALLFETAPFLLAGVVLSSVLGPALEHGLGDRVARLRAGGAIAGILAGMALPMCDCGSRPLAHRLALQGKREFAVAFLVAAPVFNPIVLITTWLAFRDLEFVALRLGITAIMAGVVALLSTLIAGEIALPAALEHEHSHESLPGRVVVEFVRLFQYLVVGAAIAAFIQVKLDQSMFTAAHGLYFSIAAMVALSFLLSICSSVDAFVVAGLGSGLGTGPALAFLVFGPVMNLKTSPLYLKLFNANLVGLIAVVALQVSVVSATVIELRGW